jgi:hypothetical protein
MEKKLSEDRIQQEMVIWFRNHFLKEKYVIFAVPNHGKAFFEQLRKKYTGLLAGVSDLIVLLPNYPLFIEVKTPKGIQSENQKKFQKDVENLGFEYFIVRTLDEFKELILSKLK